MAHRQWFTSTGSEDVGARGLRTLVVTNTGIVPASRASEHQGETCCSGSPPAARSDTAALPHQKKLWLTGSERFCSLFSIFIKNPVPESNVARMYWVGKWSTDVNKHLPQPVLESSSLTPPNAVPDPVSKRYCKSCFHQGLSLCLAISLHTRPSRTDSPLQKPSPLDLTSLPHSSRGQCGTQS